MNHLSRRHGLLLLIVLFALAATTQAQAPQTPPAVGIHGRILDAESKAPVYLGERCTVFMESEMLQQQQLFTGKADVLAGLAYSIAENYINPL